MDAKAFGEELAAIVKAKVEPLIKRADELERRLEAADAEIRAGHERIKVLEARHE